MILDRPVDGVPPAGDGHVEMDGPPGPDRGWSLTRLAPKWSATSVPIGSLLLAGVVAGPHGVNLLSTGVLSVLDTIGPAALAALGVRVALGLPLGREARLRFWTATTAGSLVTTLAVSAGIAALTLVLPLGPSTMDTMVLALLAGVCAASSGTAVGTPAPSGERPSTAEDADNLPALLLGALLLAWDRQQNAWPTASLVLQSTGATVVLALAGWLMLRRSPLLAEQRIFSLAALLLLGGASDYLAVSTLFGGLIAGLVWRMASGPALAHISRDVTYVLHPLLGLVLLMAGAHADLAHPLLAPLSLVYLVVRTLARWVSAYLVRRMDPDHAAPGRRAHLVAPGVLGVALALNAFRVVGPEASLLVSVAVVGTMTSDWIATIRSEGRP